MNILAWTRGHFDVTFELLNRLAENNRVNLLIQTEHWECGKTESVLNLNILPQPGIFSSTDRRFRQIAGDQMRSLLDPKIRVFIINYPSIRIKNLQNLVLIPGIRRLVKSIDPDIIHVQGVNLHFLFLLPFFGRYKKVFTVHDYVPHSGEEAWQCTFFNRFIAKMRYPLIAGGIYQSREFARYYRVPLDRLNVIPFGALNIYMKWAAPDVSEESSTVLFFGRISPYKGLEYLIRAEPVVSEKIKDLKIIIAGDGDLSKYKSMMKDPGRYEIHNQHVSNELAARLFQRAACVVLPYTDATQSGVLMTAYGFGKPVVVTNAGGLPEAVRNGSTGMIVPARSAASLARALTGLLGNNDRRATMKKMINALSGKEFSWERAGHDTESVYQRALSA
jgi:glycosyltransferase involved in cell wall biosynthesis